MLDSASKDHSSTLCLATKGGIILKRWITFFVSFSVLVSVFSLGVYADTPNENLSVYLNAVYSTDDFQTAGPANGSISERVIAYNYNQKIKITGFTFTLPASMYFLIDFNIVGDDTQQWSGNTGVPYVSASRNIVSYNSSDISVNNSFVEVKRAEVRTYYSPGKVHFTIFGQNNSDEEQSVLISYNNPIITTGGNITGTPYIWNQKITNVVCVGSNTVDIITDYLDEIESTLNNTYFEIVSIDGTLSNFYNEFHSYWETLVNTYVFQIFKSFGATYPANTYNTMYLTYNNQGIASWSSGNQYFGNMLMANLRNISRYLQHHTEMENKAIQRGSNDAYDALADEADYGSLVDFAGAGSAASWSTGSFVDGLDQTWSWFTIENKNMIDAVQPNRNEIYISIYDDTLAEYNRILGGD